MATITIKGHDINALTIRDSYDRRAVLYKNNIIEVLRKIGIKEDDINIKQEVSSFKSAPALVSWYMDDYYLYYSYKNAPKYVENLFIVFKVIEIEVKALLNEERTVEEFIAEFSEDHDIEDKRKEARESLGIDENIIDMDVINARYKELAKKYHPDKDGGDPEMFKKINRAHKILKRELQ